MTIYFTNIKRILKKRSNIVFMIVLPVLIIALIMKIVTPEVQINVGVIDNDRTKLTSELIENLRGKSKVTILQKDTEEKDLIDGTASYVIDIPQGFTNDVINGKTVKLNGYSLQESNIAATVKIYVNSFLNAAINIGKSSNGDETKFYLGMNYYRSGNISYDKKTIDYSEDDNGKTSETLGMVAFIMLYLSSFSAAVILEDKKNNSFYRIFTTPVSIQRYMLENILSFFTVCLIPVFVVLLSMKYLFNVNLGSGFLNIFILMSIFSMVSVSIGLLVSSVCKNSNQATLLMNIINTPFAALGGCMFPVSIMPKPLVNIGKFMPTYWLMNGINKSINGQNFYSIIGDIGIMLLFTIIFLMLSSWKKTEVAA